jgi:hypothetical protein
VVDDVLARLGALAATQHGLVTLDQLRAIGVSRRTLDRLLARGQLLRDGHRVFLVHGAPANWQQRIQAQRLSAGDDAVVSHRSGEIGVEGKSREHHLTDVAFESDSVRDADLAIAGWIIIHVTWAQIRDDPAGVVRRVRQALRRRAGAAA